MLLSNIGNQPAGIDRRPATSPADSSSIQVSEGLSHLKLCIGKNDEYLPAPTLPKLIDRLIKIKKDYDIRWAQIESMRK